jgi:hydrogenase-4 transcriptional activator
MLWVARYWRILLDVWREACRHIDIGESTARIGRLLTPHMPLARIVVYRVNLAQSALEPVAGPAPRAVFDPADMRSLLAWCRAGQPAHGTAATLPAHLRAVAEPGGAADALIGPLQAADERTGLLVLVAPPDRPFDDADVKLLTLLLEPFSAALDNDQRLHEMTLLREAAEADRRTLLAKLGRKDVATPIVGAEVGLRPVMERVVLVAASDVPVLLFGETGTGKEVIARAVHTQSPRAAGPFIRVNCGAIPPELIDSQLFGHERGSFTGATETRKGWFERADGGTLFLDEIGDLPPAAQVRLLRVLQDGALERVGGQRLLHVDVRVVGATHRDLAAMVRAGTFREDLWYRLAVFPISIPPLRERPEDIGALACHFAEKAATRFGLALAMPTGDDIRRLTAYAWPGNVRELQAVIDRAALLGNGRGLQVATALGAVPPPGVRGAEAFGGLAGMGPVAAGAGPGGADAPPPDAPTSAMTPPPEPAPRRWAILDDTLPVFAVPDEPPPAHRSLNAVMRLEIENALVDCHGRIEGVFGAAQRLQIHPNTLRARMRKLGIDWRQFRVKRR